MGSRALRLIVFACLVFAMIGQIAHAPTTSAAAALKYLYGSGSQTGGKDITLRVELTEPAPSGGATVTLSASHGAINVPASTTVPAGQTEKEITVGTDPVASNTNITVSATYLGVTKSRSVLIKAPVLTSLGLQTVIRHGGVGKVIARISGPAPAGGFAVTTSTDPAGHLDLDATITIPAGETELSLKVPASLFQESNGIELLPDLPVDVTISAGAASFTKSTIIRDFGDDPRPTATATATLMPTSTATNTPTETATSTATATETATGTPTATATIALFDGCDLLKMNYISGQYLSGFTFLDALYTAGEQIYFTASEPAGPNATTVELYLAGGPLIDSAPFPGTVEYTIPADGVYAFTVIVVTDSATWNQGCDGVPPIPQTPTVTNTPEPTNTATATATSTATDTPTSTPTDTPTNTPTSTDTPTNTPIPPTATPTRTPSPTATPIPSMCNTLNDAQYDGLYQAKPWFGNLRAGDVVSISMSPGLPGTNGTALYVYRPGLVAFGGTGTFSYTYTATGTESQIEWTALQNGIAGGNGTWAVSCTPAP